MTKEEYQEYRLIPIFDCPKHGEYAYAAQMEYCGCPRTKRTNGYLIFKDPFNAHNWIVWDVIRAQWSDICGDWQTAVNQVNKRIKCNTFHDHGYGSIC